MSKIHTICLSLLVCATSGACVLAPRGFDDERQRLADQGKPFEKAFNERELPPLAEPATWKDVLERAFLANGELEAAWFEWSAALSRVTITAGWPNTNLAPSFSYLVSGDGMKAWDRTTVSIGFDAMQNLSLPVKVRKAGEVALAEARATGARFAEIKFRLQREVLDDYLRIALDEEELRLAREDVTLAQLVSGTAARRVEGGGATRDLARAQVDAGRKEDAVRLLEARLGEERARLNGLLARPADAPLVLPAALPEARAIPADDATLLAAGVDRNPELEALAFDVRGRADALELARLQYLPDFNPFFAFTGSIARSIGVGVTLPTTLPQIEAGVEMADASLHRAQALARQTQSDRAARYVAALVALRDSERQAAWFETRILPAARQVLDSTQRAYTTGSAGLVEMLDAEAVLLDVRRTIARARVEREMRLSEIEELSGVDVETMSGDAPDAGAVRTARVQEVDHE
jgi:outer membrane protein TolC